MDKNFKLKIVSKIVVPLLIGIVGVILGRSTVTINIGDHNYSPAEFSNKYSVLEDEYNILQDKNKQIESEKIELVSKNNELQDEIEKLYGSTHTEDDFWKPDTLVHAKLYEKTEDDSFSIGGTKYYEGITFCEGSWVGSEAYVLFNPKGKYKEVTFIVARLDNGRTDEGDTKWSIFKDGVIDQEFTMAPDAPEREVTIELENTKQLKISRNTSRTPFGIAKIKFT